MLKMLLIKAVKELMMMKTKASITLLMLMMSPISTLVVVDVVVEYPSH